MTTFETIKKLAKEKHMSLSELNKKAGLGTNTIYSWKTSSPSLENISKVAKILMVSPNDLLNNTDSPSLVSEDNPAIDIENDKLLTYRGRPIPDDYLDIIRNLMDSDIERGKRRG